MGGSLIETGGSFNLEMTIVCVRIQSGKAQVQELLGQAGQVQNQIQISSSKYIIPDQLINTCYHLLVTNNYGRGVGGGGLIERGAVLTFLP